MFSKGIHRVLTTRKVQNLRVFSNAKTQRSRFPHVIMSGIQPTGIPHIGNYLGAIRPWVKQQSKIKGGSNQTRMYISIVDMHALTSIQKSESDENLNDRVLEMTACLIACGIDPQTTVLFQQSKVYGHTELTWILSCLCSLPTITHQPQWKERSVSWPADQLSVGLLTYPILQAADILLYRATHVPVGEDQIKHLEMTRHLVNRFHNRFCGGQDDVFPRPISDVVQDDSMASRICSLRDPDKKMSKSALDKRAMIYLTDSDDEIVRKIRQSVTDSIPGNVTYDADQRSGVANLIRIASALRRTPLDEMCGEVASLNKVQLKDFVSSIVVENLSPIRQRLLHLLNEEKDELRAVLRDGNARAQRAADETMGVVSRLVYGPS